MMHRQSSQERTVRTMLTIEEKITLLENFAKLCEQNGMHEWKEEHEQFAAWLRELQERRKEQYLTIEQIAAAVGSQTIYSARLWLGFARVLDDLGYAVVERRTE